MAEDDVIEIMMCGVKDIDPATFDDVEREAVREDMRDAIAALREAGLVIEQDWRPIETAPMEERIWLYIPTYPAPVNQMLIGIRYPENPFWYVDHATIRTVGSGKQNMPTHWKPLPREP